MNRYLMSVGFRQVLKLMLFLLCTIPSVIFCQSIVISGIVKDSLKQTPIEGVTVRVKNGTTAAGTDARGFFSIKVPGMQSKLQFSAIGYATTEIRLSDNKIINLSLRSVAADLDNVIVIGYGTTTKSKSLGTIGRANVEDMQKAPVPSFDQALAGRVAGVVVTSNDGQPGSSSNIVIRGSSLTQDASPLYVVDGFPMENMDLNSINPADIESLEVLKDASSIAIYGSRGANGVIMITTKRGKAGPTRLTFNFSDGYQKNVKRIKMMSPYEFVKLQLELDSVAETINGPSYGNLLSQLYIDPSKNITLESYKKVKGYDWQNMVLQDGSIQNANLGIIGGNEVTKHSLSLSFFNQKGIIVNTGLKRYDGRFSIDHRLSSNVRTGLTVSYSNSNSYGTQPSGGGGVVQGMWQYRPVGNIGSNTNLTGVLIDSASTDFLNSTSLGDNLLNPYVQAINEYRHNINNVGTVNGFVDISFLKNFRLRIQGGYNADFSKANAFYNSKTKQGMTFANSTGAVFNLSGINASLNNTINQNYTFENTLTYNGRINTQHVFNAVGGVTFNSANTSNTGFNVINIPMSAEYLGINSISSGGTLSGLSNGASQWQLYSFLSRLQYTYNRKYSVLLTGRTDGSSKFAPGHQWGYFSAISSGWSFSEEEFMSKFKDILGFGKLKVSYGSVGNNKVGDFSYLSQFSSLSNYYGYVWGNNNSSNTYTGGLVPYNYGNDNLTWETTKEFDLGTSLTFLKGRLSVDMDYYSKRTNNFLLSVAVPYFGGYAGSSTQYRNSGSILNRGFELTIGTDNVRGTTFLWNTSFNIGFNRSKLLSLTDGKEMITTNWGINSVANNAEAWIAKIGGPLSAFYGYKWGGLYQYKDFNQLPNGSYILKPGVATYSPYVQPGDPKYLDLNGDGIVDANDRTTLGSPLPTFTGGLTNNFVYKNFTLNIFFQFSFGNQVLNANKIAFMNTGSYYLNGNQFAAYANRWTPDNTNTDIPRARITAGSGVVSSYKGDAAETYARPSSWLIEDGSFIRLKTISFGYNLPAQLLRRVGINGANFYVAAQNLFTISKYSGIDPEVSTLPQSNAGNLAGGSGYTTINPSTSYSVLSGGYDFTPYPRAISVTIGCKATF